MFWSPHGLLSIALVMIVASGHGAVAQQCPPNSHVDRVEDAGNTETVHCKCDGGYEKRGGTCVRVGVNPQCVKQAGERLQREQQQGCARILGQCFQNNRTPLSATAVACVAACRQAAGCSIGCGIGGLAAEALIEKCVNERNNCFEAALARHRTAVDACKG